MKTGRDRHKKQRSKRWEKHDWAEWLVIFFFLTASVIALGAVGALMMDVIVRLIG